MTEDTKDPRDVIIEQVEQVADYLARLERLVTEPRSPHGGPARPGRPAIMPEPYGHPGRVLMTTHEGVRRLEVSLRIVVTGDPGRRRGGSDGNTAQCLDRIAKLATQLDKPRAIRAARFLAYMIGGAQSVDGIDEATRWRHIPPSPETGKLPPQCPYCRMYYLVADVEALIVCCSYPSCPGDADGNVPTAAMGYDGSGNPMLTWADGRTQHVPGLAAAGLVAPPPELLGETA